MKTEFGVRFSVTVACKNSHANFFVCFCFVRLIFCRLWMHLLFIRSKKYNLDLLYVMSFHLVPHLPRLVAMVTKFFMCDRKVSNLIYYFLVICIFIFINNHGEEQKMQKNRPLIK